MVLRSAGYKVDGCASLGQLRASLQAAGDTVAVLLSDGEGVAPEEAASLARSCCSAPVVLFNRTNRSFEGVTFDLVVHSLTPPEIWLREVGELIARSRVLGAHLAARPRKSLQLLEDSAMGVNKARSQRVRSLQERARNTAPPPVNRQGQDSVLK
jgi:hypothetical protein